MASKSGMAQSLIRTYTSIVKRHTLQSQSSASQILGLTPRLSTNDAIRTNFEGAARTIDGGFRLQAIPIPISHPQRRWHSTDHLPKNKAYQYEDVLAILETPSASQLLIDVREPHEYEANTIPTAINLPIASQPDALLLNEEDFEDRFGFAKPPLNKEVVFFCKAGVRSSAAAGIARQAGYVNIGNYSGSWLDWQRKRGPGTKTPSDSGIGEPRLPIQETKPVRGPGDSGEEDLGSQGASPYPPGPDTTRQ